MSATRLHFVVPGPLDQRTGGYLYDAQMVRGLRSRGWTVKVRELPGRFPDPDDQARTALAETLASLPDGSLAVVDGLALGLLPEPVAAASERIRIVGLIHHPLAEETGLPEADRKRYAALERRTLNLLAGVVVTSPFTASRVEAYGVPADRIRTVVPGTRSAPPAKGPRGGAPPSLVTVGSVTPRKGHDVLVEALTSLGDLEWEAVCAGSLERAPDFAAEVRRRVKAAGLQERIRFLGELDRKELGALYRTGSLFVLPSWYEGYGMAFTEALARGLPVVGTTGGAIPSTVPKAAGILVPPGDASALADAVRSLLEDPERRAEMATAARAHASSLPDWGKATSNFSRALRSLIPEEVA